MEQLIQDYQTLVDKLRDVKHHYVTTSRRGGICSSVLTSVKQIRDSHDISLEESIIRAYHCKNLTQFVDTVEAITTTYQKDTREFMLMYNDLVLAIPALYKTINTLDLKPLTKRNLEEVKSFYEKGWVMDMVDTVADTNLYGRVRRVVNAVTEPNSITVYDDMCEDFDTLGYSVESCELSIPEVKPANIKMVDGNWDNPERFNDFKTNITAMCKWVDLYNANSVSGDGTAVSFAVGTAIKNFLDNKGSTPSSHFNILFEHMIDMAERTIHIPVQYVKCRM